MKIGLDDMLVFVGVLLGNVGVWLLCGWPGTLVAVGVLLTAAGLGLAWRRRGQA